MRYSNSLRMAAGLVLTIAGLTWPKVAIAQVPEPSDYHIGDYHSPVPDTLKGARVVTTKEAHDLWLQHDVFIDVLPQAPKPAGLPPGTIWIEKPRLDIPGSTWLPDTGYGQISGKMEFYFEDGLNMATHGDRSKPVVFYCLHNCWMSWNAARRAITLGFSDVIWFRDGTDGWQLGNYPLQQTQEFPGR